ncbi:MAG: dihydrolipoamide dehydrogenase [Myxococcota bacterium]|jgi:dihydrolipoamide dehydrogenase
MEHFDLVVLGAGPGGATAAKAAALRGLRVALVDDGDLLGYGLRGAYQSKAMFEIAREHYVMRQRWELSLDRLAADFAKFTQASGAGADALRAVHRSEFDRAGITVVAGRGHFRDPHTIAVASALLHGAHIMVSTGTRPRVLPGVTLDGERILTSDEVVDHDDQPESLLVLGAGVIGCEFASIFAALGAQVTLLDTRARILSHEDPDISEVLRRSLERLGVRIEASVRCKGMEVRGEKVHTALDDGRILETDAALLSIGRVPNTEGIGLEAAGVTVDKWGYIPVDDDLVTNVPHIYAAGDVGMRPTDLDLCLVHVAEAEARRAIAHLCGDKRRLSTTHVPFIIFTLPMVAGAGESETSAREKYGDVRVGKFANVRNHRAHARGTRSGFIKLIVGPTGDDRVLGVRAVGDGVDSVVGEVSLMIQNALPYTHLLDAIHAHPSLSESLHGAAQIIAQGALPYLDGEEHCQDYVVEPVLTF